MNQKVKDIIKYGISIIIAIVFLWLALANVDTDELWTYFGEMSYGWMAPFVVAMGAATMLRAERWRLLAITDGFSAPRTSMNTAVFLGYAMNYVIPRMGEVTRCVYISKKHGESITRLIATVVVERVLDVIVLLGLIAFVVLYVITEPETQVNLFGEQTAQLLQDWTNYKGILILLLLGMLMALLFYAFFRIIAYLKEGDTPLGHFATKIYNLLHLFSDGLMSIKRIKNWPYFIFLTTCMWFCYVLMTYIPFYMFNMVEAFNLTFADALTLMIISAVGIALPSPGGVGTYHFFVKQTLFVLFAVPAVTGLAYAFVTHVFNLLSTLLYAGLFLGYSYLISRRAKS